MKASFEYKMGKSQGEQERWIAVKNQLPKDHEWVIVSGERKTEIMKFIGGTFYKLHREDFKDDANLRYTLEKSEGVTHWQSIPEEKAVTYDVEELEKVREDMEAIRKDDALSEEDKFIQGVSASIKGLALLAAGMRDNWEEQFKKMD